MGAGGCEVAAGAVGRRDDIAVELDEEVPDRAPHGLSRHFFGQIGELGVLAPRGYRTEEEGGDKQEYDSHQNAVCNISAGNKRWWIIISFTWYS